MFDVQVLPGPGVSVCPVFHLDGLSLALRFGRNERTSNPDNGAGQFDLKPCSISTYQVKLTCQSMVEAIEHGNKIHGLLRQRGHCVADPDCGLVPPRRVRGQLGALRDFRRCFVGIHRWLYSNHAAPAVDTQPLRLGHSADWFYPAVSPIGGDLLFHMESTRACMNHPTSWLQATPGYAFLFFLARRSGAPEPGC